MSQKIPIVDVRLCPKYAFSTLLYLRNSNSSLTPLDGLFTLLKLQSTITLQLSTINILSHVSRFDKSIKIISIQKHDRWRVPLWKLFPWIVRFNYFLDLNKNNNKKVQNRRIKPVSFERCHKEWLYWEHWKTSKTFQQ